ncbi:hypothetical protein Drorol1_Dr00001017 [Drosera rotundifolia]
MVPEIEKARITEIQVRMDCNGCVQRIKKALTGMNGIYDLQIDLAQQKIIIIGWVDPEKIVKAIKKTRKVATICSHTEVPNPPAPAAEPAPDGGAPPADNATPPPAEAKPAEAPAAATEPPKDQPPPPAEPPKEQPPPTPENPPPGVAASENKDPKPQRPTLTKDVGEVRVIYHYPPVHGHPYGYRYSYGPPDGHGNMGFHMDPSFRYERSPPVHVMHSHNTFRPSSYITGYQYIQSPPRYAYYDGIDQHYEQDYERGSSSNNGTITAVFSDENPNACTIV